MWNKIAATTVAVFAGATVFLATGNDVDITGSYPKPSTHTGLDYAIPLCTKGTIKMPCGPHFTPGITKANNNQG